MVWIFISLNHETSWQIVWCKPSAGDGLIPEYPGSVSPEREMTLDHKPLGEGCVKVFTEEKYAFCNVEQTYHAIRTWVSIPYSHEHTHTHTHKH